MQDRELVTLLFKRDECAVEEISKKWGAALYSVAYNLLKNKEDADECVNDTLLALWNTIPPKDPEKPLGYVLKIVRNLSLKKWREKNALKRKGDSAPMPLCELEECISDKKSIDESLESKQIAKVIDTFLRTLKKEERDYFVLRYFYALSIEEISEKRKESKQNVKTRLFRTRQKLLKKLEKEGVVL